MFIELCFDNFEVTERYSEHFKFKPFNKGFKVLSCEDDHNSKYESDNEFKLLEIAEYVEKGIYLTGLNFNHDIERYTKYKEESFFGTDEQSLSEKINDPRNSFNTYGVCDSIEQWKERFGKTYSEHPLPCVISFVEIAREDEPEEGGWRWHKWGPYIGTHTPQFEYLYDEKDIDRVFVWKVIFLKEKIKVCYTKGVANGTIKSQSQ